MALAAAMTSRPAAAWTHVATSSNANRVVVSSAKEVRTSADGGATFHVVNLPAGMSVHSAAIADDGTVVVARADELGAPSAAVVVMVDESYQHVPHR